MKKIITTMLLLSGASSCAFSAAAGPYVGAAIQAHDYHNKLDFTLYDTDDSLLYSARSANTNVGGTLFAGYNFIFNSRFNIGLQGDGEINANTGKKFLSIAGFNDGDLETLNYESKNNYGFGISILPRMSMNKNTDGFFKLGYRLDHFSTQLATNEQDFDTNITERTNTKSNNWRSGFEYGLGIQTNITSQLDVFLAATQTMYGKKATRVDASSLFNESAYVNRAQIGIVWHDTKNHLTK